LLKPISFDRFLQAVQRVQARQLTAAPAAAPEQADYLFVKTDSRLLRVSHADIYYIEGGKEYATLITANGNILTLTSLAKLSDSLPTSQFQRVHKSYIVALNKIESVERQRIYLAGAVLPVGDTYRAEFARRLGEA